MKRVLLALMGTVAGLVALLGFKVQTQTQAAILPSASAGDSTTTSAAGTGGTTAAPADGATPAPTTAAPEAAVVTLDGDAIRTRYGTVQVEVQMKGSTITSVSFLQLTAQDRRSQEINASAGPILLRETLQAQSARISTVSGATYTSDGYTQSLQSALDQAAK